MTRNKSSPATRSRHPPAEPVTRRQFQSPCGVGRHQHAMLVRRRMEPAVGVTGSVAVVGVGTPATATKPPAPRASPRVRRRWLARAGARVPRTGPPARPRASPVTSCVGQCREAGRHPGAEPSPADRTRHPWTGSVTCRAIRPHRRFRSPAALLPTSSCADLDVVAGDTPRRATTTSRSAAGFSSSVPAGAGGTSKRCSYAAAPSQHTTVTTSAHQ